LGIADVFAKGIVFFGTRDIAPRPTAIKGFVFAFVISLAPIFAEGIALETFPHQNQLEVGMAAKVDAHQVVGFALLEINARPNGNKARYSCHVAGGTGFDSQRPSASGTVTVIDHLKVIAVIVIIDGSSA